MAIPCFQPRKLALVTASALLCASAALAVPSGALNAAQALYRQDMAVCNSGASNQSRGTCRREARNALAEARRGALTNGPGAYQDNARQRCAAHQGGDRADCEARVRGEGNVQGSVAGGGVLRETVTIIPAE